MKKLDDNGVFHEVDNYPRMIENRPMHLKRGDRLIIDRPDPGCTAKEAVITDCWEYRYGDACAVTIESGVETLPGKRIKDRVTKQSKWNLPLTPRDTMAGNPMKDQGVPISLGLEMGPGLDGEENVRPRTKYDEQVPES